MEILEKSVCMGGGQAPPPGHPGVAGLDIYTLINPHIHTYKYHIKTNLYSKARTLIHAVKVSK